MIYGHEIDRCCLEHMVREQKKKHSVNFQDDEIPTSDMLQEPHMDYFPTLITPTRSGVDDKYNIAPYREVEAIMSMSKIESY